MTDNIKPDHYRKGEIDLYEAFSQIFPHNEYRAGMQMIAMRYMFRDKIDRVEDLNKAMETLERLKEKEIEHREKQVKSKDELIDDAVEFMRKHQREHDIKTPEAAIVDMFEAFNDIDTSETIHKQDDQERISLLKNLLNRNFGYLAKDLDNELWAYDIHPRKSDTLWIEGDCGDCVKVLSSDTFPEVQWSDEEPTKITDLLENHTETESPSNINMKTAGQYLDEIYYEHKDLLKRLWNEDYRYLARDKDGRLYAYDGSPVKSEEDGYWDFYIDLDSERVINDDFPQVKWSDNEPTTIAGLLYIYGNGGENGKADD